MLAELISKIKGFAHKIRMRLFPPSWKFVQDRFTATDKKLNTAEKRMNDRMFELRTKEKYLEAMTYLVLHKQKEDQLREKIRKGKKAKVIFIIQYAAKFECKSVYEAMLKSDIFEPYLLINHPRDRFFDENPSYVEEAKKSYQLFRSRGYRVIFGYDEYLHPIPLDTLRPDIVFWNNPNMYNRSHYQNIYLNANYLTCYIPYFFNTASLGDYSRYLYSCENWQCITAWKVFVESYPAFYDMTEKRPKARSQRPDEWMGVNAVLSGYPKLDAYANERHFEMLPAKIRNGKPIVIYAPHWSIVGDTHLSTFHIFNQQFKELRQKYQDINFVFKPHPDLRNRIIDLYNQENHVTLTPDEYDAYVAEWDNSPNGICIEDGEYIDLFKASTCLITDCGSFVAEWLPSGNPCIYILNPEKEQPLDFYSTFGRRVVESYYCCSDWETIEQTFKKVVLEGEDPNKELRAQIVKESYLNVGVAGQYICDYLERQLTDE